MAFRLDDDEDLLALHGVVLGDEEGTVPVLQDYLEGAEGSKYPSLNFYPGVKTPIIKADGKKGPMARGFFLEEDKMTEDLVKACEVLVQQKKAEKVRVQHGGEKVKTYYRLYRPTFFFLTLDVPSGNAIYNNVEKQRGLAWGYHTVYNEKDQEYNHGTYMSILAVNKELHEAGYHEKDGTPKALRLGYRGKKGEHLLNALRDHFTFVKNHRKAIEQAHIEKGKSAAQAKALATYRVQFFAYACSLEASDDTVTHGQGQKQTDVYIIENRSTEVYEDPEQAESQLYCGKTLYAQLMPFLYDMSDPQHPVAGGEAVLWCREEVERFHKNQEEWNPKGQLEFGVHPAPAYMKMKRHVQEAQETLDPVSAYSNGHSNGSRVQQQEDPNESYRTSLSILQKFFAKQEDQEGLTIVGKALKALNNEIGLEAAEVDSTVSELLIQAGKRKKAVLAALATDGEF